MEVKEQNNYNNSGQNSTQEDLERVLDNPDGLENGAKKEVEKKVFVQKDESKVKIRLFKDLGWYWRVIKKPVLILAELEVLMYVLALFPSLEWSMAEVFDPILLVVDFIFFGWIVWQVKVKKAEGFWQSMVTVFLAGFSLGLIMSIFKVVWIREYWTIFNLISQPVFTGLVAVAVGLVVNLFLVGLFIKRKNN